MSKGNTVSVGETSKAESAPGAGLSGIETSIADDATIEDQQNRPATIYPVLRAVAIALVGVVIFRTLLVQPFTVPTTSMLPNLYDGDYIVVSKWDYGISKYSFPITVPFIKGRIGNKMPARGDVVVIKMPTDVKKDYVKRIIGLPGDKVQVHNGQILVNDRVAITQIDRSINRQTTILNETLPGGKSHKIQNTADGSRGDNTSVYTVPAGQYFMMGDNRDNSLDSRFAPTDPMGAGVGFVPEETLEGRVVLILMSWNEGSSPWKPWTWFNFRWDRFFKSVH